MPQNLTGLIPRSTSTPGISRLAFVLLVCMLSPKTSPAQSVTPSLEVDFQSRVIGRVYESTNGMGISESSHLLCVSVPLAGTENLGLASDFSVEHFRFGFTGLTGSPPLDIATNVVCQPTLMLKTSPSWSFFISPTWEYFGAARTQIAAASIWSGSFSTLYRKDGSLQLGIGIQTTGRLAGSPVILPFPLIEWKLNEILTLSSADGQSGRLSCALNPKFSLVGQMEYRSKDIRLARASNVPADVLRIETLTLCLGLIYKPYQHITFAIMAGKALNQSFLFLDASDRLVAPQIRGSPWTGFAEIDCQF